MTLHGHIENGAIVLDEQVPLPEGAAVQVRVTPKVPAPEAEAKIPTLAERLKNFIGILEDLPEDAAENHDHYLYGCAKEEMIVFADTYFYVSLLNRRDARHAAAASLGNPAASSGRDHGVRLAGGGEFL